ncbi:MAG: DUF4350 domain-containing protein [Isosphaeraceae bacterium]|nr:DUF4350 domain-containing protein [Isosphaeraceae bacterium]
MTLGATLRALLPTLFVLALAGCGSELETDYGYTRGKSLNGTGVLAELFRKQGHEIRAAVRLTDELEEWADVIVRFAPYPGPPALEEADWYARWLDHEAGRRLVYVVHDYDAEPDFWTEVLSRLPQGTPARERERVERRQQDARHWSDHLPTPPKEIADATNWFSITRTTKPPSACKTLEGPWADGIDAKNTAITRHDTLKVDSETVLLKGDGEALVMEWTRYNGSRVLVAANGSFLVNAALLNKARRPLADGTIAWATDEGEGLSVAFVEGRFVTGEAAGMPSIWSMLRRLWEFRWIAFQMLLLGLAVCLARAARLGRPRSEPSAGTDRPVAHPEALGALLARTRQAGDARAILEAYRRWRFSNRPSFETASATETPATAATRKPKFPRPSREL